MVLNVTWSHGIACSDVDVCVTLSLYYFLYYNKYISLKIKFRFLALTGESENGYTVKIRNCANDNQIL